MFHHPRFEANPNTGVPIPEEDGTTIVAHNTVHHASEYPSHVLLPVVPLSDLPKHNILSSTKKLMASFRDTASDVVIATKMLNDVMLDIQKGGL